MQYKPHTTKLLFKSTLNIQKWRLINVQFYDLGVNNIIYIMSE